jgi:exosortase/archaeosortase family protein
VRTAIALSAVPVAILANGLRVASAGVAAHNFGSAGVEGLFHDFSGWVVFILAFAMMLAFQRLLLRVAPPRVPQPPAADRVPQVAAAESVSA